MAASDVFARIDREVWIITAQAGGRRSGLTATWVSAASLDPARPIVLAGLAPNHFTAELVLASGEFCAQLLHTGQSELAWQLAASSGRAGDKLAGLALAASQPATADSASGDDPPRLADCAAWLRCRVFHRYDAGDRWFFWADCLAGEDLGKPVLREQAFFASLAPEQRRKLGALRAAELPLQLPLHEAWRQGQ